MFAVKGWNISAPLRTQTATTSKKAVDIGSSNTKTSKKRKRTDDGVGSQRQRQQLDGINSDGSSLPGSREGVVTNQAQRSREENGVELNKKDAATPPATTIASLDDPEAAKDVLNRKEKKKKRIRGKKKAGEQEAGDTGVPGSPMQKTLNGNKVTESTTQSKSLPPAPIQANTNLTPLQSAMRQKLISSRFRYLNETLYTTSSADSLELFRKNPTFFNEYHEGFARQVDSWPENPVNGFAALVVARGRIPSKGYTPAKLKGLSEEAARLKVQSEVLAQGKAGINMGVSEPLPRDVRSKETVAVDLGCGIGALARQLQPFNEPLGLVIHSFDLSSPNEFVKVADIRNLPLSDNSVDVAVFSLALMGTNWIDFVEEAWRVLKWKGECWIADVKSRFSVPTEKRKVVKHSVGARLKAIKPKPPAENSALDQTLDSDFLEEDTAQRKDETDVSAFVSVLKRRGFELAKEADLSNKMFARMRFTKTVTPTKGKGADTKGQKRFKTAKYFIDRAPAADEVSIEEEAAVLKPCVYKVR